MSAKKPTSLGPPPASTKASFQPEPDSRTRPRRTPGSSAAEREAAPAIATSATWSAPPPLDRGGTDRPPGKASSRPASSLQLAELERLAGLGRLTAGILHEVNNAMTVIVGYAGHLRTKWQKAEADEADIAKLERITKTASRLQHFSRDLVHYARPSAARFDSVAVHDVLEQALAFSEDLLERGTIRVQRRFAEGSPVVSGVDGQLVQVFVNLIANAAHAMLTGGGTLTIESAVDPGGAHAIVAVSDTGSGIAPDHLERIFEPFFTTKAEANGTGLGLAVVRTIVERHAGSIAVESTQGRGTRFVVRLPASRR